MRTGGHRNPPSGEVRGEGGQGAWAAASGGSGGLFMRNPLADGATPRSDGAEGHVAKGMGATSPKPTGWVEAAIGMASPCGPGGEGMAGPGGGEV